MRPKYLIVRLKKILGRTGAPDVARVNFFFFCGSAASLYGRLICCHPWLSPIRDRAGGVSLPLIGCLLFHCSKCELKKCDRPEQAERQSCLNETEKKINTTKRVKMKRGRNIESFFIKKSSQDTGDGPWEDANWPRSFGDSIIDSEPEETTESEIEPGPETQINKPKMYSFRHDWLTQFPWLRYDKGRNAMHCIYCRECGQNMAGNSRRGKVVSYRNVKKCPESTQYAVTNVWIKWPLSQLHFRGRQ
ncbi:unnamed protein product [Gadus morhua 'NCC']